MTAPPGPIPVELANFEVVSRLGAGGMAEVFLAKKRGAEGTYKLLVVKRILPSFGGSRRFRTMFVEEAQLATRLNHPNVVQVYEFFDGGPEGHVLAMEYVEGCTLGQLMQAGRNVSQRIGPWIVAFVMQEAAKGLHYAHEKRDEQGAPLEIVHRDVSPQNVLLSYDGSVKITDFGIASARVTADEAGVIKGKYGYMSPEQARGEKVDRRSDLYSLGVVFWECLTGRALHGGLGGEALLDMVRGGRVEAPSVYVQGIPPELETIVMKLLAEDPGLRFDSGREVASAIGRALVFKQEFIDAVALEARIGELYGHAVRNVGPARAPAAGKGGAEKGATDSGCLRESSLSDPRTQAAIPAAFTGEGRAASARRDAGREGGRGPRRELASEIGSLVEGEDARAPASLANLEPREVRHVVLATLRLHTREPVGHDKSLAFRRALEALQRMLGEMAYKRGMRWVWSADLHARAIAGLAPKHARAPFDAAQLALDTHEAIAGYSDAFPVPLDVSMSLVRGIASGSRDPEGNLVRCTLHEPVEYLAEVVDKATPASQTWVAGGLYRLIWRDFVWHEAMEIQLDTDAAAGLPKGMRIYELERRKSKGEIDNDDAASGAELVGRDLEKADLHAAFHTALNARPGGLLTCRVVFGELGIGKTALIAGYVAELPDGVRVLRVECTPVSMEVPFGAIAELLREATGVTGDEPFEEIADRIARLGGGAAQGDSTHPTVARLAELAGNRKKSDEDDDSDQRRIVLAGLRNIFAAIALTAPLVLVLDGFQWADRQSIDLFTEVLRTPDPLQVLVLVVTRPDDRLAELIEGKVRIELDALAFDEQVRLLEQRLGAREGVREVCAELVPRVGGNPFFLLEMVDALLERGSLELRSEDTDGTSPVGSTGAGSSILVRNAREEDGLVLPSTLEQLLADRIQELPREERVMVDWLAVAGGPLTGADLLLLSGAMSEEPLSRILARGLCDRRGELVDFRHPLTRDVAYATLDSLSRARMHGELGEHLEKTPLARGLSAAVIARHFVRGNESERAIDFYLEAADSARASHQIALAVKYFRRGRHLMSADDARLSHATENLENLYRTLGRKAERAAMLTALRQIAQRSRTPKNACLALVRTARFHLDAARLPLALPAASLAARLAHEHGLVLLSIESEALLGEISGELGDVQGALAACDRALAACDPKNNHGVPGRTHAEVLRTRGVLLRRLGRVREAVDSYADAIALCRRTGARRLEARTKNSLAYAMFVQGRYEDAIGLALQAIQLDLSIGGRFQIAKTLTNIGHAYARLGDFARAAAYLKRARESHDRYGDLDGQADTLLVCAEVELELGRVESAFAFFKEAQPQIESTKNGYDAAHSALVHAAIELERRNAKEATTLAVLARRLAEPQALVAYSFYGVALEAAARAEAGEVHTATLLATTGLGAVETLQGCEYGLEIRALCADVLKKAGSPQAGQARQITVDYAMAMLSSIRDSRLRRSFAERPTLASLFDATPVPGAVAVPSLMSAQFVPGVRGARKLF